MTKLLPYKINWSGPFEEAYAYKTEVITSRDKTEQRIAWRSQPRLTVSYTASPVRQDVNAMWNTLRFDMAERAVVAKGTNPMRLASAASASSMTITVTGTPAFWATAGKFLVAYSSNGPQLLQIASRSGSVLTLQEPLNGTLAAGAPIYQGLTGALDQTMKAKLLTTRASNLNVDFSADPGDNIYFANDDPAVDDMFGSLPLLLVKPNWAEGVDLTAMGFLETTDFAVGKVEHNIDSFIDYSDVAHKGGYSFFSTAAIESMKSFFHKVKGQQKPFIVPAWIESTIDLSNGADAGSDTLYVAGTDMYNHLTGNVGTYSGVITFYQSGLYQTNTITSYTTRLSNPGPFPGFYIYRGSETTSDGLIGTLTEYLVIPKDELPDWHVGDRLTMVSVNDTAGFQSGEITFIDPDYSIIGTALVTLEVDAYSGVPVTDDLWLIYPEGDIGVSGSSGYTTVDDYLLAAPRETVVTFEDTFDSAIGGSTSGEGGGSAMMLYLIKARFLVDTLTLAFQTATVATTQLTYKPMKGDME